MAGKQIIISTVSVETELEFDIEQLCRVCQVTPEFIVELIEYGIVDPRGSSISNWRFTADHLRRVRMIAHLQQDLEVNLSGAALVVELMDEIARLRAQIQLFEKYLGSF
jgi:chaperone modulatory protein CbpM